MSEATTPPVRPRIRHNDYTALDVPDLGTWTPRLSVSVLIPAYGDQDMLDLALAALAAQSYPAHLMEALVVDDGSVPPLRLPEVKPERTRLLTSRDAGADERREGGLRSGSALAVHTAARAADGDVLHRIDVDMLLYREHIEAVMRWHHHADYLVVLGYKRFVDRPPPGRLTPERVRAAVADGAAAGLFDEDASMVSWQEQVVEETGGLRSAPHRAYRVSNGATISFPPALYEAAGGMDTALRLGSDVEIGYRMAQAGAVFVPEPLARAWHLGIPQMRGDRRKEGTRYREPWLSQRIPLRRDWRRHGTGRQWLVPYVDVVVEVGDAGYEEVRACVTAALSGTLPDVQVTLVGPWGALDAECRTPLDDPLLDLRLIHEAFRHDGRVRLRESVPEPVGPIPYHFRCPPQWALTPEALARLIARSDDECLGVLYCALPKGADLHIARLDRTQALARARLLRRPGEDLDDVVHETFGTYWIDGTEWALTPASGARPGTSQAAGTGPAEARDDDAAYWKRQAGKWRWRADHWKKEARRWEEEAGRLRDRAREPGRTRWRVLRWRGPAEGCGDPAGSEAAPSEGTAAEGSGAQGSAAEGAPSQGAPSKGAASQGAVSQGTVSERGAGASAAAVSEGVRNR